jgi:hypothetical protein
VPQFTYYLARAQSGLGSPEANKTFEGFLATMPHPDPRDQLAADARAQMH